MRQYCITVVTVVYNDVGNIEKTIQSVISQKEIVIEYIVIDGGSTDGTVSIIENYRDNISYYISERDGGIYDAMNKGLRRATGRYICFMNSGDTFYGENTVRELVPVCDMGFDVIYGNTNFIYDTGAKISVAKPASYLKYGMPFSHQSSLVRLELLLENPFDLSFNYVADYNFFYQCYFKGCEFYYAPQVIANFNAIDGVSLRNIASVFKEIFYVQRTNRAFWGLLRLKYRLFRYLVLERIKVIAPDVVKKIRSR